MSTRNAARWLATGLLTLAACRGVSAPAPGEPQSPTPGSPPPGPSNACPNTLGIPDGYPPLGGDCGAHVWTAGGPVSWPTESIDLRGLVSEDWIPSTDRRGVRRQPGEATVFDLGYASDEDAFAYLGILVPSLELGRYVGADGAAVRQRLGGAVSGRDSDVEGGAVDVEIIGRTGEVIWGRFLARLCGLDEGCQTMNGRFSARIDGSPSEVPFGFGGGPYEDSVGFCWSDGSECRLSPELPPGCGVARCVSRECVVAVPPSCI
jgi:hypothetical protein